MKRFLLFLVIAIAVVSLGLTIYFFSTDNEAIYIKNSYLIVERGDYIQAEGENGLLEFRNKSKYTTLNYSFEQKKDSDVLFWSNDGFYIAMNGGESKIIVSTNNRNYSKLIINVLVCDGSVDYPYIIKTETDLRKIGNDEVYTKECSYKLNNDISLTSPWTPISDYSGVFNGNYFSINDIEITGALTNAGFVSNLTNKGVIKNLFLNNINISVSGENVGAYAGISEGIIQACEATGTITNTISNTASYVGAIAGKMIFDTQKPKIDRCGFEGAIVLSGSDKIYAGGIVGLSQSGIVSESYYRGLVKNSNSNFGGIVGYNASSLNGTSDIYDSYFYLKENQTQTKFSKIGGVVYKNEEDSNLITGNYFGGEYDELYITQSVADGELFYASNGYLTKQEFTNKNKFITTASENNFSRKWNFNSVWELPTIASYPILNVYSSVGSSYIIDVSNILTSDTISNAQELYNVLSGKGKSGAGPTADNSYRITNDILMDPNSPGGFVWGDASHPIPLSFGGKILNDGGYKITNLTINNPSEGQNVGLVKELLSTAILSGLRFDEVTFIGQKGNYVGVLAGQNSGANVYNITITNVNVNISGVAFGTLFGYSTAYEGHGIKSITTKFVDCNSYFVYAGGMVGINLSVITAITEVYNYSYDINLCANYAGGIAGANGGSISYTTATGIKFNKHQNQTTIQDLYSGTHNIFIGGLIGMNEITLSGVKVKGNVVDVYTNINVEAQTGSAYKIYAGGIAGYNSSNISRAYVKDSTFIITGSNNVFAGGITGYNSGMISRSIVSGENSLIRTSIVSGVGTTSTGGGYLLSTDNCSIVGGLVGYDTFSSNSTYSIYQSASYMKEIKGYYAGGIVGIAFGKIEKSFCGNSTKESGGVTIKGFLAGGIASVVASGFVKDCYAFCNLDSADFSGKYVDILSVIKMEVSAMGGIAVLVLNKDTLIQGCYAVVSFSGPGVSFGSSADLTGFVSGTIKDCAYQTEGSVSTSYGTKISESKFRGSDSFQTFNKATGYSFSTWLFTTGLYPILEGVIPGVLLPLWH